MVLSEDKKREFMRRLLLSRMRLLNTHGFYGILLMHMQFGLDEASGTAYPDGTRICFHPDFLGRLTDSELDFVLMHELLHVVLQHCTRGAGYEQERYNIAADIVVNSNILLENKGDLQSITIHGIGESMHLTPDGKEGSKYTAEQVYEMLPRKKAPQARKNSPGGGGTRPPKRSPGQKPKSGQPGGAGTGENNPKAWDDHTHWSAMAEDDTLREVWQQRVVNAAEALSIRDPSNTRGLLPAFAQRIWKNLIQPQTDWREILQNFVQMEINDYSFSPPDRRYLDTDFFLPDFNELGLSDRVSDILFMIDTSGSMSDDMITAAFSEVKGAVDQFGGSLKGWLGFFDAAVIQPTAFEDVRSLEEIRPYGGGGTDFEVIFSYVRRHMEDNPPAFIIILTDGFAPFPEEHRAGGIPVLWLLNNETVTPPWGKVARIRV